MSGPNLDNYVEVNERIAAFHERYPDGSLQGEWDITQLGEATVIVYTARAYRDKHDPRPGVGTATEPVPGRTPYTKDSELMNAETSAWGRALAALGFEVKRGIASKEEVQAAQSRQTPTQGNGEVKGHAKDMLGFASDKQRNLFARLLRAQGVEDPDGVCAFVNANYQGGRLGKISKAIDALKDDDKVKAKKAADVLVARAAEWTASQSDVPADTSGLTDHDKQLTEDIPFA